MNGKNTVTTKVKNRTNVLARVFEKKAKPPAQENLPDTARTEAEMTAEDYLNNARDIANRCFEIVKANSYVIDFKQNKKSSAKRHISISGWQALALAHGCTVSSTDVTADYDNQGKLLGYKARGYVKRIKDGIILTEAEGYTGVDEWNKLWGKQTFSRRSMAQTRAMSRACRAAFAHITGLMNNIEEKNKNEKSVPFSDTPLEEMPKDEISKNSSQEETPPPSAFLTDEQKSEIKQSVIEYEREHPEGDLAKQMREAYREKDKAKIFSLLKDIEEQIAFPPSEPQSSTAPDFSEIIMITEEYKLYYGEDERTKQIAEGISKKNLTECGFAVNKMRDMIAEYKRSHKQEVNDEVPI